MKRYEFEQARKACAEFVKTKKAGVPCRTWYLVDIEALQTSLHKVCKPVCRRSANCIAEGLQTISETTAETTAEISTIKKGRKPDDDFRNVAKPEAIPDQSKQLVHAFRAEANGSYFEDAPKQVTAELRAATCLLKSLGTVEDVVGVARLNSKSDFPAFRGQSATLVRLQQNLSSIKARLNGAKHAGFESREIQEHLTLPRIQL